MTKYFLHFVEISLGYSYKDTRCGASVFNNICAERHSDGVKGFALLPDQFGMKMLSSQTNSSKVSFVTRGHQSSMEPQHLAATPVSDDARSGVMVLCLACSKCN